MLQLGLGMEPSLAYDESNLNEAIGFWRRTSTVYDMQNLRSLFYC